MRLLSPAALLLTAALSQAAFSQAAQPAQVPDYGAPIGVAEALAIVNAGMRHAQGASLRQAFAVVEPSGELVAFARMDGLSYGAIRAAEAKARTAARYRVATAVREQQLMSGRLPILSNEEVMAIGGGVPIVRNGRIVGAVGVSGGSTEQDASIAALIAAPR